PMVHASGVAHGVGRLQQPVRHPARRAPRARPPSSPAPALPLLIPGRSTVSCHSPPAGRRFRDCTGCLPKTALARMTVLHCSQKLLRRLRQPATPPEPPPGDNPLGPWCADIDFIDREPFALLMNAATGALLVLPARAADLK